jgi:GT2 family glycosyltransferase
MISSPTLSVSIPTFNNVEVLKQCIESWRAHGDERTEIIVVEDGCRDGTADYLRSIEATAWGVRQFRWIHQDDAHELRCTNAGIAAARAPLVLAWQDDMFLRASWLVPELIRTFARHREIAMIALSRGLYCLPLHEPIRTYSDLIDWRRLPSTIGPSPGNWFRLYEVDAVIRPWVIRKAAVDKVGPLDEAFRPTEWDEADLAYRLRSAGWNVATSGYERLGAYFHLGSTTLSKAPSEAYFARVLENGRLFHERWDATIAAEHPRSRRSWMRTPTAAGWMATIAQLAKAATGNRARLHGHRLAACE